ncbi:MAG: hypothetical protein PUB43_08590, partial [Oscillospiraceae bacterium]|nr:hypothetical protein [Oscillospiraceae bacterium]
KIILSPNFKKNLVKSFMITDMVFSPFLHINFTVSPTPDETGVFVSLLKRQKYLLPCIHHITDGRFKSIPFGKFHLKSQSALTVQI